MKRIESPHQGPNGTWKASSDMARVRKAAANNNECQGHHTGRQRTMSTMDDSTIHSVIDAHSSATRWAASWKERPFALLVVGMAAKIWTRDGTGGRKWSWGRCNLLSLTRGYKIKSMKSISSLNLSSSEIPLSEHDLSR